MDIDQIDDFPNGMKYATSTKYQEKQCHYGDFEAKNGRSDVIFERSPVTALWTIVQLQGICKISNRPTRVGFHVSLLPRMIELSMRRVITQPTLSRPWHRLHMDICGPFTITVTGNQCIIKEEFKKYLFPIPIESQHDDAM
uniref:Uncharacterized protein n=1 Tax=Caenorhabditis japonica TaxID=281687 RepID=A0A8R1II89_CAEJA